jgi:hypothetical protein
MSGGGPFAGSMDMSKFEGQAGFGSSDMYGEGSRSGGGVSSMFDAATAGDAAALAAAKVLCPHTLLSLSVSLSLARACSLSLPPLSFSLSHGDLTPLCKPQAKEAAAAALSQANFLKRQWSCDLISYLFIMS